MTDITVLAQRMKAAAKKLDVTQWQTRNGFSGIEVIVKGSLEKLHGLTSSQPVAADLADTKTARAIALFSPANVLALIEALELKEEQRANWFQMAQKLGEDLDAAEKHIAELEGAKKADRTVTVEPFRSFVTDADLAALHRFAECCDDPESGGHDLEKEQVLRLEAIGALRRSGCVHWITGFGYVLISITADIRVEDDQ